jgi:antitoxin component of RelBE/YafQ-DinJ toxin-antitoxin module
MGRRQMRTKQFNVRMNDFEFVQADIVARSHGLNIANVIRMLLKQEADRLSQKALENEKSPTTRSRAVGRK